MEILTVNFKVFWRFKEHHNYKVTNCKKIINSKTNKILKQRIKGGQVGFYINKKFYKRKYLNLHIEKIPKKEYCPF